MRNATLRRSIYLVCAFAGLASIAAAQPSGGIVLDSRIAILERADAPDPVKKAAEDLAGDFEKVLGTRPRLITSDPGNGSVIEVGGPLGGAAESFSITARVP